MQKPNSFPTNRILSLAIKAIEDDPNLKEKSRKAYVEAMPKVVEWAKTKEFESCFKQYKIYLQGINNMSASRKNFLLSTMKKFLVSVSQSMKVKAPVEGVRYFQISTEPKRSPLSEEEVASVIKVIENKPDLAKARLMAIFTLEFHRGLRRTSLYSMNVEDVNLSAATLAHRQKGRDDYEKVKVPGICIPFLEEYLKSYNIKSGPVFFSISNNSYGKRLTEDSISRLVRDVMKEAGISQPQPHRLRNSFINYVCRNLNRFGFNMNDYAKLFGHKNVATTTRYLNVASEELMISKLYEGSH